VLNNMRCLLRPFVRPHQRVRLRSD
jgi:hypothetical protein